MNYSIQQHIQLKRVSAIAASPEGDWLATAVQRLDRDGVRYVSDIWKVPIDGSAPIQLTRGDTQDTAPFFRSDGALAFLSNRQPNEIKADEGSDKRMQVWILPVNGGEPVQLTDEPLGVEAFQFAKKGNRLILLAPVILNVAHNKQRETALERIKKGSTARYYTQQPVRHWDHWLNDSVDLANTHIIAYSEHGQDRVDLTPDAKREFAIDPRFDVSADGKLVAATRQTRGSDRDLDSTILLIDIDSNRQTIFGRGTNVSNESVHFTPDGRQLATVRSVRSPQTAIRPLLTVIDIVSGEERTLAKDWDRWPHVATWTREGTRLIVTADDEGDVPVYSIDATSGKVNRITSASSGGTHSSIEVLKDGRVAGIRSTMLEPPECFVVHAAPGSTPETLTCLSGFAVDGWAEVERCEAASPSGPPVQFFLLKPKGSSELLPALLWIHGGPMNMHADGWHWRWNPLLAVAKGYAVALPNPRGSTGFGQKFVQGIWGNVWGDECYKDLMHVTDVLQSRSDVDGNRIMAMGGSFGGYMTNWIGTQTDRFRCLITHASIFTMAHFTGVTDHSPWWYIAWGGEDPYADQSHFDRYAPVRYVKNWKTPTLIIHGELDYRCPIGEGLNLFEALQYHDVVSELLIFPDENHWILKPRNIVVWYESIFDFLNRYMK